MKPTRAVRRVGRTARAAILRILVLAVLALVGVAAPPNPVRAGSTVSFSRYVAVGDGMSAGFQDGALRETGQQASWVAVLAHAAGAPIGLPLLGDPGLPTPNPVTGLGLLVQRPGTCAYGAFDLATGRSEGRIDPAVVATNLAIPYHRVGDAIERRWTIDTGDPDDADSFEDFVLGIPAVSGGLPPRSQLESAVALDPTFVTVWLGFMDVVIPTQGGEIGGGALLPTDEFESRLRVVLDTLDGTGADGAVLNLPNISSTPLLVSAKELRRRTGFTNKQLRNRLGVQKSSWVLLTALPDVDAIAAGDAEGPLAASQILTRDEMDKLDAAVAAYNAAIERRTRAVGWALVDLNALMSRYERRGVAIDGVGTFTTRYLGGLYGLDGVHPSNTGQVLIAAAVISAINARYGTSLPIPAVTPVAREDPHTCGVDAR